MALKKDPSYLVGTRFGRLVVTARVGTKRQSQYSTVAVWECRCDCGGVRTTTTGSLQSGRCGSCGCKRTEGKHGHTWAGGRSPTYISWQSMIGRCYQPGNASYAHYHARGITVCARWRDFSNFLADMGVRPSLRYSIDRYPDNNGNYEPTNCRWATRKQQAANRSNSRR